VTAAQRRSAEAGADREIHQIINAAPRAERAFAEDRHLRIVLKKDGESECGADRPRKIGAWEAWAEIRWLHRNTSPRVEWPWCADANANEARDGGGIFTCGVLACELQRGDTRSHYGCRSISCWCWRRSTAESRSVWTHECGAHLCAAKVKCEHRCISGWLHQ
jgi:hypothetical protein